MDEKKIEAEEDRKKNLEGKTENERNNNGKTYFCSMKVDGDILKVHGSLDKKGWVGRTMDWYRVKE